MRPWHAAGLSLVLGVSLLPASSGARYRSSDVSIAFDDEGKGPVTCDALRVRIGGREAAVQEVLIDLPPGDALSVRADSQGGIFVQASEDGQYTARLCKAAAEPSLLAQVRPVLEGHRLSVEGPHGEKGWVGYLLVDAPADASMTLTTGNAPIKLKGVRGTYVARALNGPIEIENASATIEATTENGPIALSGSGGDVTLRAHNGPLAVELDADWRGKGLHARTENGPIALRVGSGFRSGLVVESRGQSPWACEGSLCDTMKARRGENGRTLTLGGAPAVVRLTTENGPVAIQSPEP